jgi:aspartate/glutamate racemase
MPPHATPRIALIHALAHSVAPINDTLAREWPEAQRMNLLDDSLSADVARSGRLDDAMTARFLALGDYAAATGVHAILFTCSAFGVCIDAVTRRLAPLPVLKPNEAMVDEAAAQVRAHGGCVGLLATFAPTLASMQPEFASGVPLRTALADGALEALNRGDTAAHDRSAVQAAQALKAQGCTVIALAQFSLARAQAAVAEATGLPVLTTPDSAVRALRRRLS